MWFRERNFEGLINFKDITERIFVNKASLRKTIGNINKGDTEGNLERGHSVGLTSEEFF